MLLFQGQSGLLKQNLAGDGLIPPDDVLQALGRVVRSNTDADSWRTGLRRLLLGLDDQTALVDHLAGVQFLASVGAPTGARLLASFWEQADLATWTDALTSKPELEPLLELVMRRADAPLPLATLAAGVHCTLSVAQQLKAAGLRRQGMDLLTATALVQANHGNGQVVVPLDPDDGAAVESMLEAPQPWPDSFAGSLEDVSHFEGLLIIDLAEPDHAPQFPDGFPTLIPGAPGEESQDAHAPAPQDGEQADEADKEADDAEIDNSALKKLVLDNIMSTSVLLEFLRDAKVTGIPGLVEEVVNRTRNPQIIETVVNDRRLHTGFANKGVPLACLRSPVNVSIKALRKFVHVKYISKVDLKRMATDRTGVRKEVAREIERYLASLA